jgi:hypothetical protein
MTRSLLVDLMVRIYKKFWASEEYILEKIQEFKINSLK